MNKLKTFETIYSHIGDDILVALNNSLEEDNEGELIVLRNYIMKSIKDNLHSYITQYEDKIDELEIEVDSLNTNHYNDSVHYNDIINDLKENLEQLKSQFDYY